jgi:hypothetical protein
MGFRVADRNQPRPTEQQVRQVRGHHRLQSLPVAESVSPSFRCRRRPGRRAWSEISQRLPRQPILRQAFLRPGPLLRQLLPSPPFPSPPSPSQPTPLRPSHRSRLRAERTSRPSSPLPDSPPLCLRHLSHLFLALRNRRPYQSLGRPFLTARRSSRLLPRI